MGFSEKASHSSLKTLWDHSKHAHKQEAGWRLIHAFDVVRKACITGTPTGTLANVPEVVKSPSYCQPKA